MSSPIVDLQQRVLDHDVPVSTLLRYGLLIAKAVKDEPMVEWCTNELNGYKSAPLESTYRIAYGEYMATDVWGRDLPVMVKDPKMLEAVTKVPLWMSVGDIESMLSGAGEDTSWKMFLSPEWEAKLRKGIDSDVRRLFRIVQKQQLQQVLEGVRNKLFDWTMDLQGRGVKVDDRSFPKLPAQKESVVASRTIQTNNYVEVNDAMKSPVQVGTKDSSQTTTYRDLDLKQVAELISMLERDVGRLDRQDTDVKKLMDEIETLKNLLKSPSPKHSWLREGLGTVQRILENGAGTVLGEVVKDGQYLVQIGRMLGLS